MKFIVAHPKSISVVEAARAEIEHGVLTFFDENGVLLLATAPGHWTAVRRDDFKVDAKAA